MDPQRERGGSSLSSSFLVSFRYWLAVLSSCRRPTSKTRSFLKLLFCACYSTLIWYWQLRILGDAGPQPLTLSLRLLVRANPDCFIVPTFFIITFVALFFYDYLLTFAQEVKCIWARKPTGASFLFALNRYAVFVNRLVRLVQLMSWKGFLEKDADRVRLPLLPLCPL